MDIKKVVRQVAVFSGFFVAIGAVGHEVRAENFYASAERKEAAVGHYARARALLVEALREFEAGRKIAKPDMLLDSEEWRISVVSRTEELNRVLDPKPRVSKSGVYYSANPLLLRMEKERLPAPAEEAQIGNAGAELDFKKSKQEMSRARMAGEGSNTPAQSPIASSGEDPQIFGTNPIPAPQEPVIPELENGAAPEQGTSSPRSEIEQIREEAQGVVENRIQEQGLKSEKPIESEVLPIDEKNAKFSEETKRLDSESGDSDEAIAAAIEQAIKARMEKLSTASGE